ncbi:MAG: phosphatase PAP2 family protein [Steroidobacteraceae bacterium]|nr:phosphatase PAP2 family protein [Steroidobacteraceae bacterium]
MTTAELPLCLALNRWGSRSFVHGFFATISRLGDGVFWYASMTAMAVLGGSRGAFAALHMAATGLAALALYKTLKRRIRRPRPCAVGRGIVALVAPLDQFSFPSGHTLHAVAFTVIACAWFPALAVVLVPFAMLVGLSRVVLGLHYPSDVLAATAIGLALAAVSLSLV